ncbi:hypothetical protein I4F81_001174 [Pyropia yezoensis]|uniref:Uncharacterized protein n=1 Tax=Pyropia yezoensis TaxID=2788 RepID=A0ACC3BLW2_PYRYE|nr:hypothetical protein I4F81_001174 [Neopyropia yezoensis]
MSSIFVTGPTCRRRGSASSTASSTRPTWRAFRRYRLAKLTFDTALAVAPGGAEPHRLAQSGLDNPLDAPDTMRLRYAAAEAWMTLHRDFVTKAVTGDLSRQLLALLAPSLVPEEHFFAMLAANHPALRARTANDAMRGIVWTQQGVPSEGARPYYVDSRDPDSGEYLLADRVLGMSAMFVRKMRDVLLRGAEHRAARQAEVDNVAAYLARLLELSISLSATERRLRSAAAAERRGATPADHEARVRADAAALVGLVSEQERLADTCPICYDLLGGDSPAAEGGRRAATPGGGRPAARSAGGR